MVIKFIRLFISGIIAIILGIYLFKYAKKLVYEWPKRFRGKPLERFLSFPFSPDKPDEKNKLLADVYLAKGKSVLLILVGVTLVILSILTILGKF